MDELFAVLGNSHFEAYVGGPIAGVIAGLLFAAAGNPSASGGGPGGSGGSGIQHHHHHHHHYHQPGGPKSTARSESDPAGIIIAAGMALLVTTFLFVVYLDHIAWGLYWVTATLAWFSIAANVHTMIFGQLDRVSGFRLTTWPSIVALASYVMTTHIRRSIHTDVSEYAQQLLNGQPLSAGTVFNASVSFFRALNVDYFEWIGHQMLASVLITLCIVASTMQTMHYIAISKANSGYGGVWIWLSEATRRFNSWSTTILTAAFLILAWLLSSGVIFQWKSQLLR